MPRTMKHEPMNAKQNIGPASYTCDTQNTTFTNTVTASSQYYQPEISKLIRARPDSFDEAERL